MSSVSISGKFGKKWVKIGNFGNKWVKKYL